jgi:hypothetical protein
MKFGNEDSYDSSTHGKYRPKSDMNYDGASAQVFFTCLLGLVCLGLSAFRLRRWVRSRGKSYDSAYAFCPCHACRARRLAKEKSQRRRERWARLLSDGFWLILWLLFLVLVWGLYRRARESARSGTLFDPYEILGVSKKSSREDVTRAYRRRSLELHPDKNLDNPNYRPEEFVNLNKAYRVLIDPVALENYQKYGNPDGYQGTRYGIALPSWLVTRGNLVLIGYAVLLLFGLPVGVGLWWRRRARFISDSVSQETYALFAEFLGHSTAIKFRNLPEVYGAALEFSSRTPFQTEHGDQEAISLVCQALESSGRFDHRDQRLFNRGLPHFTMNNVLLHAHLARLNWERFPISMKRMRQNLEILLAHMDCIVPAMVDVAGAAPRPEVMQRYQRVFSAGGYIDRVLRVVQLEQSLCQAMLPSESELLQIPWFGPSEVKVCTSSKRFGADGIRTVAELRRYVWEPDVAALVATQGEQALCPSEQQTGSVGGKPDSSATHESSLHSPALSAESRYTADAPTDRLLQCNWDGTRLRSLLRMFTDAQLDDVHLFLCRYPRRVQLEVVEPYVVDQDRSDETHEVRDSCIHACDAVTLEVRLRIERGILVDASARNQCHPCCRNLPFEKKEHWWIIVGDRKMNSIVAVRRLSLSQAEQVPTHTEQTVKDSNGVAVVRAPEEIASPSTSASSHNSTETTTSTEMDGGKPQNRQQRGIPALTDATSADKLQCRFQFMAPPQLGACKLVVHALPDCYFGLNRHVNLDVEIHDYKLPEPETHYFDPSDLSEDDEDRIRHAAPHSTSQPTMQGSSKKSNEATSGTRSQPKKNRQPSDQEDDSSGNEAVEIDGESE